MIAVLFLAASVQLIGQGNANNSGASGSAFLDIGVGARAMGMGGAVATLVSDPTALYWNPAGIASINTVEVSVERTEWVADMQHSFFGLVVPLNDQFKAGLSVIYLTSGNIDITTIDQPQGTGETYSASDVALGGTLGWSVTNVLSVGASLKYVRNTLYNLTASGIAFDVGTRFDTQFHGLMVAFAVSNLAGNRAYQGASLNFEYPPPYPGADPIQANFTNTEFSLPLSYRASVGTELFQFIDDPLEGHKLNIGADLLQPYDSPEKLQLGAEYGYNDAFFVRTGYIFNADELGLNAGVGVHVNLEGLNLRVDYGYAQLVHFNGVQRFGVELAM
jgi:hypothetical protein